MIKLFGAKIKVGQKVYFAENGYVREYTVTQVGRGEVGIITTAYGVSNPREEFVKEDKIFATKEAAIYAKQTALVEEMMKIYGRAFEEVMALVKELMGYSKLKIKLESRAELKKAMQEIAIIQPVIDPPKTQEKKKRGRPKKL